MNKKKTRKDNIYVIKIGGSAFDIIKEKKKDKLGHLGKVFQQIANAHKEGFKMVLTTGAGPWGDHSKDFGKYFKSLGFQEKPNKYDLIISCCAAADIINYFLKDGGKIPEYDIFSGSNYGRFNTENFLNDPEETETENFCAVAFPDFVGNITHEVEILEKKIITLYNIGLAVQSVDYQVRPFPLPDGDSDAHTLLIADLIAKIHKKRNNINTELIFIKDTKGIYKFDPNRKDIDQNKNEFYKEISIDALLDNIQIDRTGTDHRGGHLLETRAAELFRDKMSSLSTIRVINAREPGRFRSVLYGENRGSIIYNKNYN